MPAQITGDLQTVLTAVAFAPLNDRGFLHITGPDAPRWLNGMVTNNVQALQPGEGNYNFLLSAQGRIQGDCTIYRDPKAPDPTYILETDKEQLEAIQQLLDKFIIMDDVELTRAQYEPSILLVGTRAPLILGELPSGDYLGDDPPVPGPMRLTFHRTPDQLFQQITTPQQGLVPRFHLVAASGNKLDDLSALFKQSGCIQVSSEDLESLRILEARPRYGTDVRNTDTAKDLPQETNQPQALHFAKGCYVGQEIVERIRSRGQVHRLFTPFRLEGGLPTSFPAPLEANGKPAGELTSATTIPTTEGPVHLALGYARREFLDTRASLTYSGGTAHPRNAGSLT